MTRHGMKLCNWMMVAALCCAWLSAFAADNAGVRAWLDRDTMHFGETVTLNVEADGSVDGQPDFSVLAPDFTVQGTQSSQQVSIVNGARSAKTLWAVGLEPKREGSITIAPIALGQAQTAPIRLSVLPATSAAQQPGGDLFLEASAQPLDPYVQQQVRYTVKLYYAFDLTDGNLGEPKADGLATQRIGQDKQYVATVGTRRYHVLERHYALTPERSGAIEIPALAFRGSVLDASDPSAFFGRGRSVSARSDALHLDVKPKPASWTQATWLPATSLLLQDQGELPTEVHVGEPVTRTVRMQAQGLGYEQLPELQLAAPEGAEIYPDKADTRTRDDGEWLYGERVRKFAFVPDRAGTLTVPGLSVTWWDTAHDRQETTELPARTVKVLPAAGAPARVAPTTGSATASTPANANGVPGAASAFDDASRVGLWKVIAAIGFLLWAATLLAWWSSRRIAGMAPSASTAPTANSSSQRAAFLRACALGDLSGAERALVTWARHERTEVRNLGELAMRLSDDAQRTAASALQRARYAGESVEGIATRLQQAFRSGIAWSDELPRAANTADPLPPLYPKRD